MKLTAAHKIGLGVLVMGGLGYAAWKYWVAPPLTVFSLNPIDGSGHFQFGGARGAIAPGGYDGGWGWTLSFASFSPGTGWTVQVTKNGAMRKSTLINSIGTIQIA